MIKVAFFQKDQLGLGLPGRKWPEMGQKLDFRALFSEIQLNIDQFSSLEHLKTRGCVAKWLQRLGQFPIAFEKFELSRDQFPSQEPDFFSSFKLIFVSFFYMHIYYIMIKSSQKFWVVYVHYRFIPEQCAVFSALQFC